MTKRNGDLPLKDLPGKFIWRAILITVGIVFLLKYPSNWWLGDNAFLSVAIGGIISAVVVAISFVALTWSFDKSNRTFMITYVVGFLGRLLILSGAILIISRIDSLDLIAGSIAILIVYLSLTALEIKMVNDNRSSLPG